MHFSTLSQNIGMEGEDAMVVAQAALMAHTWRLLYLEGVVAPAPCIRRPHNEV